MAATAIRAPLVRLRAGRLDDGRLAALAASGDERAFEVIYDRHHRALLGFCRHMLGAQDEGEDALQQTFLRAHRSLLAQGAPDELRPWLFAIARNRCLTMLAARKAAAVPVEEIEPATDGLSAGVEERADLRALLGDIARLPDDQRSALVLAEVADLSHAEIARVIGVPTAKVKALVHQARTRLIADRDARETPCADVREQLSTARAGELRRGPLRRHLALCDGCRAYKEAVTDQRKALALALPVLPSAGLKDTIFGALGGGGGGAAAAASGGAAGGAALSGGGSTGLFAAKGLGAKLAIGAALAGGAGGGAVVVERVVTQPERPVAASAARPGATDPVGKGSREATGQGADTVLVDSPGNPSATGKARREAAAEHRRERAQQRAAAKRRRAEARAQARRDRAAGKRARVLDRQSRKQDLAAAKERRTSERQERLAARPERGNSATNRSTPTTGTNGDKGATQRSATTAPRVQAPVKPAKPVKPTVTATPAPIPTPDLAPADDKGSSGKGRSVVE
ncbi:MAG TPA: RNA polymerase sigma factor [Solirubrobacteraceae bacterium]|nr:RNA polymerase sigma factor [Solirubrobacteraceae bacterium]